MANPSKLPPEVVSHLRRLAHDLSNSLETIMQASYLLSQMELEPTGKKWVELIDEAAQDAAHLTGNCARSCEGRETTAPSFSVDPCMIREHTTGK